MPEVIDPYYEWLGIPPKDQPPNHYRLLGLELFETNRKVIDAAANRQMGFIKEYQTGPYGELTQRLLNELSAARICLLSPQRKAAYDRNLKQALEPGPAPDGAETETLADLATMQAVAPTTLPRLDLPAEPQTVSVEPRTLLAGAGVAIGCLLTGVIVGIILLRALRDDDTGPAPIADQRTETAPATPSSEASGQDQAESVSEGDHSTSDRRDGLPGTAVEPDDTEATDEPDLVQVQGEASPSGSLAERHQEIAPTAPAVTGESDPASGTVSESTVNVDAEPDVRVVENPGQSIPDVARLPVPTMEVQQQTTEEVRGFYDIDTRSESRKRELCEELLALGRDRTEKPERRFVLLRLVAQMAIEVGDCATMFAAVDEIACSYDVQGSGVKAKLLLQMLGDGGDTALVMAFLRNSDVVLDELLDDDDFHLAGRLSSVASGFCDRPLGSKEFREKILARHVVVQSLQQDYDRVQAAMTAMRANANDAGASVTVGRWLCFVKNDWERGLSFLARGDDEQLKAVANSELQSVPENTSELFALGDRWWNLAQGASDRDQRAMMLRAGHWYGQIEPTALSGMDCAKLRRRAADIERLTGESQPFASERELASQDESEADSATPSDLASLFNRGLTAALKEHNFEQAERFFGRCVDLDSEHIPSLNNNALASLRCANSRRAIHMFRQAIDRAPQTRAVAHNLALISRLASKGRASMDSSTRGEIESLLAIAGEDSTYRIANGFVYMAYDDEGDVARDLVDCTCLYCNGVGRVDCPLRGCTRGTVASTRSDISGRDPVTGRTFVKVRPIRVPCSRCGGRGMVDCPHCRSGVMSRLD